MAEYKITVEYKGSYPGIAKTTAKLGSGITRKRWDAIQFHLRSVVYKLHDMHGTRDTKAAWTDVESVERLVAKGPTKYGYFQTVDLAHNFSVRVDRIS